MTCYRVLLLELGLVWSPIVVARSLEEAKAKACDIFPDAEVFGARDLHPNGVHMNGMSGRWRDLWESIPDGYQRRVA